MKTCNYWNGQHITCSCGQWQKICDELHVANQSSPYDLRKTMDVCGIEICINNESEQEELLTNSPQSNSSIKNDIIGNSECTGFFNIIFLFCISCIFKHTKRSKYIYCLLFSE